MEMLIALSMLLASVNVNAQEFKSTYVSSVNCVSGSVLTVNVKDSYRQINASERRKLTRALNNFCKSNPTGWKNA